MAEIETLVSGLETPWSDRDLQILLAALERLSGVLKARDRGPMRHGIPSAYSSRGCRCDVCKTAYSEWRKARRATTH